LHRFGGSDLLVFVDGATPDGTDVRPAALEQLPVEREHAILQALQERLLPAALPVLPSLRVAARYRTADERLVAGGDWYDATVLGPGRLGASVGDVVGHGPAAAAVMGQLRAVLSAALLATGDVVAALTQLRRFVPTVPGARGSTACVLTVDGDTGRLSYACAGHPPPVLVRADGTAQFLDSPPSAPLGLPGPVSQACTVSLRTGDTLLLYSDGAVETFGVPTEQPRDRLLSACRHAAAGGQSAAGFADAVLAEIAGEVRADDLALLVLRRLTRPLAPLRTTVPATVEQLATLRRRLREWLAQSEMSEEDAVALQIACGEATANTVEHAYLDAGTAAGTVTVSAELTGEGTVVVRVEDDGHWREPLTDPGDRGRGLLLMRQSMDDLHVDQKADGTVVELTRRIHAGRDPLSPIPEPDGAEAAAPDSRLDIAVDTTADTPRAVLTGDLDAAGVASAARVLRRASRGGVLPLDVDLTRLGHLASAGVRLLFDLAADLTATGNRLKVHVRPGSVAQRVLDLTAFPHIAGPDTGDLAPSSG
jgi:anti-sigma regulatory factor (Ser/Thr protein kinase)/ABC-type transporter Mla MlaB component